MLVITSNNNLPAPVRHDMAKKWLHKRLWRPASRQLLRGEETAGLKRRLSLKRPHTAPTSQRATPDTMPPPPQTPTSIALPSPRLAMHPPPRPPRPDSGVIRHVNAWLDASTNVQPPPLMGGLSYWRLMSEDPTISSLGMQYAIPVEREPVPSRPLTPSSQQVRSMCRRGAKKVQAKMPSLLRTTSRRLTARKQINRRSSSMPLLAGSCEQTHKGASPMLLTRSGSFLHTSTRTSVSKTPTDEQPLLSAGQYSGQELLVLGSTRTSVTCGGYEGHTNRRLNAGLRYNTESVGNKPLSTAAACLSRDDSTGDLTLSEAPTYCSGLPPPSYRSRTASIRTTSSFGCVDGISPAQRHASQQRAATKSRGVRGRVRELRRIFQNE
ncbi:hypothetical protein SVAN01_02169 [Stagonosporopsis vannaccii]|nr:hypothetical protein SVAN01_02169 [Stagonosporopsis vannaccii]